MTAPEKPRHIDDRITGIGTAELIAAFGHPDGVTGLGSLRSWVEKGKNAALWPVTPAEDLTAADLLRTDPPDVTGAGLGRSVRYGFHYLRWLQPAVRAWVATGDESYLRTFEELFTSWVEKREGLVGEWPGLDLVWYSLGTWSRAAFLLPALDSMPPLSDECWGLAMATVIGGARWAYDEHDSFRHGNWQLVSATQLMHAGAVYPQLVEAPQWVERGRERLVEHLDRDFYADGGHYERSPGYHNLCLEATKLAVAVDERYLHTGLAGHPKVAAMREWLRQLTTSAGWAPPLQDSQVVWSEPHRAEDSVLLEESGYAVLRAHDDVRVVVNCGPYVEHELESHSHRAVLDFVMDGWGRPLIWEAGGPPDYDDADYQTWFQAARGHSTVVVDGRDVGADRDVVVETFWQSTEAAVFAGRQKANGVTHRRRLMLVRSDPVYLVVRDTVAGGESYELLLHAPQPWHDWRAGGVRVWIAGAEDFTTSAGRARIPDPAAKTADFALLHTLSVKRTHGDFLTVIVPAAQGNWTFGATGDEIHVEHPHGTDIVTSSGLIRRRVA
ncbi:heparinase II/III family protein [Fodinicola acaciae]|uniref:heparinase II/III family protein n=1 Tax=Fodinicola acaciae TaxID=2681555 RepID=UPI0013D31471|nr:heparinase II/III family protein [Fodinicola acaciae]